MNSLRRITTLFLFLGIILLPSILQAQEKKEVTWGKFETSLFGGTIDEFVQKNKGESLSTMMNILINIFIGLIIIIGAISVVIGGYLYMTAGGNADGVQKAKQWIGSALLGIALALTAWIILNTISPQFTTELNPLSPPK